MVVSDMEFDKGAGILEENDQDPEQGGGEAVVFQIFLQSCHPVGISLQCGEVGGYPLHGTGPGGFPIPGGAVNYGAAATAEVGR